MILTKLIKRLGGAGSNGTVKVLPNANSTVKLERRSSASSSTSSGSSRTGSDLSLKAGSLPTIVEEEHYTENNSAIVNRPFPTKDEDDDLDSLDALPPQNLANVCALVKGMDADLDAILIGFERVQEIVWACLDTESECSIHFDPLDPSTVPPPDVRNLESITPVDALLRAMIRTKDYERKFKRNPESADVCERAIRKVESHQGDAEAKKFILKALQILANTSSHAGVYDEEILSRLSSVMRFHMRVAFNSRKGFSPIVLSRQAKMQYDSQIPNGELMDIPHPELNVAALFHQALQIVQSGADDCFGAHDALKLRSAKRFIGNVLACAKRIENVDEKRRKAWQATQRWAGEIPRLFSHIEGGEDLAALALLADLATLQAKLVNDSSAIAQDLARLESHRAGVKDRRSAEGGMSAKELRQLRATMTGLCGRNGYFPDVVFILDA